MDRRCSPNRSFSLAFGLSDVLALTFVALN